MATPQENLQAAFPGAQTGDSVYDEGLGIYWYYDGSTWLQYSELPGKIIGPVQNAISPYEFEDKIAPNLNIGINVESFSYRLEPTSNTQTLGVTVGGSVRAVSFVLIPSNPFRSRILLSSFESRVAISATVFVETVSISLAGLEPGVEGGDAKILFISNPVTIDFNTQIANVETLVRSIEPSAAVINLTINEPQIQAVDDTFFSDVVLLIADNNIEPNTEKPSGRVFIDKSQYAKRLYQTSYVDNYSNYSNGAELVGNHRYIKSVDQDLVAWEKNRPFYLDIWAGFPKVEGHVSEDAFISTDGHQGVRFQDANVNNENGAFAFTTKTNWLETVDYPSHTLDNNDFTIEWWQYLNEGSNSELLGGVMGATNANELTYAGNGALSGSHEEFIDLQSDRFFIGFHADLGSNTLRVRYDTTGINLTLIDLGLVGGESISFYVDDVLVNATISSYVQEEALGAWENTKFVFSDYTFSANYQAHEIRIPLQQTVFSSLRKTEKSRRGVCNVLEFDNDNIYIIRNANNSYSSSKAEETADPFWDDVVCLFDFNSVNFSFNPDPTYSRESFASLKHYNGNKFILASQVQVQGNDNNIGSVFSKEEGIEGGAYVARWPYYKDIVQMDSWPPTNWWSDNYLRWGTGGFDRPTYFLFDPKIGNTTTNLGFTNVNQGLTVEFYFKYDFWFDEWNQNGWTRPGNTGIDTINGGSFGEGELNFRSAIFMTCVVGGIAEVSFRFWYKSGIGWYVHTVQGVGITGTSLWVNGDNSVVTPDDNIIEWEKWHLCTIQFYPGNPLYVDNWVDGKFIGRNQHSYGAISEVREFALGVGRYSGAFANNVIEEGVCIDNLRFTANLRYEPQQDFTPPSYPFPAHGGVNEPKEDNEINIPVSNAIGQTPFLEKTWQHVAVSRSGNDIKAFVDGIEVGNANPDQLFPITYPDNTSYWLATTSLLTIYKFDISALNITPAIDTLSLGDVLTAKVDGIFIASGTLSSLTVNGDYFEITTTSNTLETALAATSRGVLEFADLGIQSSVSAIGTGHLYYRGYKDYRASTFNGFMESFRTTLAARYTTAFTPPNTFPGLINSVSYETQNALEPSDPFDIVLEVTGAIDGAGDFIDTSPNAHALVARDSSVNVPASVSRWSLYTLMDVDTVTTISGLYYVCVFDTIDTSVGRWQWSYNAEGMHADYLDGAFRTLVLEKRSDAEAPFANGTANPFLDSLDLDVPGSFWARFEDAPNEWVRIDYRFIRRETRSYRNLDNILYTDTGYETFTFVECLEGETSYDRYRNAVYNATGTWVDEPSVNSWIDVTSVNPITTPADGGISPCIVADHPLGVVPAIRLNPGHWLQVTSPDPSLTLGQQPFTIEYWIKVENHPEAISPGNVGFFPLDVTSNPNSSPRLYVDWDEPINNAYVGSRLGKYVDAEYEGNMAHWSPVKGRSFTISDNFHAFGNEMRRKRWYHIAYTRDLNGDVRLFVNGKLSASPQTSIDFASRRSSSTNNRTVIGIKNFTQPLDVIGTTWLNNVNPQELRGLDGYITDVRIVNGQALYIEDFDPPLQTLIEADRPDDGILLTSQEAVAFKLKTYQPRVNSDLVSISVDDPISLTVQNFYSDENGFKVIVNPALRYPTFDSIPEGVDPYWDNVAVLLHFNEGTGVTIPIDSGPNGYIIPGSGGSPQGISSSKFGTHSFFFGKTASLDLGNQIFAFGVEDFTLEFWIDGGTDPFFPNIGQVMSSSNPNNGGGFYMQMDPTSRLLSFNGSTGSNLGTLTSSTQVNGNDWTHIAITREGSTFRLFVDGILEDSNSSPLADIQAPQSYVGRAINSSNTGPDATTESFSGYFDEMRVTKGVCRYTNNFTVQTAEHEEVGFAFGDFEFNLVLYLASGINSISATDPAASFQVFDAENRPIGSVKELSDGTNGINMAVWSYKGNLAQDSNGDYTLNYFVPQEINLNWGLHRGVEFDWDRREVDYGEFPDSYSEIVPYGLLYQGTLYNHVAPYSVTGARGGYSHRIAHWAGGCSWTQSNGFNVHLSDPAYAVSEGELFGNTISTDTASEASWDAYFGPEKQNVYFGSILRGDRTWDLNTGNTHPFVRVPSAPGACYGGVRQFSFARSLYGINRPYFDDVNLGTPTGIIATSADPLAVNIARNWCWVDPLYYGLNTSPNYYPVYTHPTLGDINQDVLHRTGLVDSQNIPFDYWGGHRWGWKGIKARGVTNEFHGTHVTRNTDHVIEMRFAIPKTTVDDLVKKRTFRNNAPFSQYCTDPNNSPPTNPWCFWDSTVRYVYSEPLNQHTSDESDGYPLSSQPVSKPSAGVTLNYFGRGTYSIHNQYVEHGREDIPLTRLPSIACPGSDDQSDVFTVTGPNGLSHPLMGLGLPSWNSASAYTGGSEFDDWQNWHRVTVTFTATGFDGSEITSSSGDDALCWHYSMNDSDGTIPAHDKKCFGVYGAGNSATFSTSNNLPTLRVASEFAFERKLSIDLVQDNDFTGYSDVGPVGLPMAFDSGNHINGGTSLGTDLEWTAPNNGVLRTESYWIYPYNVVATYDPVNQNHNNDLNNLYVPTQIFTSSGGGGSPSARTGVGLTHGSYMVSPKIKFWGMMLHNGDITSGGSNTVPVIDKNGANLPATGYRSMSFLDTDLTESNTDGFIVTQTNQSGQFSFSSTLQDAGAYDCMTGPIPCYDCFSYYDAPYRPRYNIVDPGTGPASNYYPRSTDVLRVRVNANQGIYSSGAVVTGSGATMRLTKVGVMDKTTGAVTYQSLNTTLSPSWTPDGTTHEIDLNFSSDLGTTVFDETMWGNIAIWEFEYSGTATNGIIINSVSAEQVASRYYETSFPYRWNCTLLGVNNNAIDLTGLVSTTNTNYASSTPTTINTQNGTDFNQWTNTPSTQETTLVIPKPYGPSETEFFISILAYQGTLDDSPATTVSWPTIDRVIQTNVAAYGKTGVAVGDRPNEVVTQLTYGYHLPRVLDPSPTVSIGSPTYYLASTTTYRYDDFYTLTQFEDWWQLMINENMIHPDLVEDGKYKNILAKSYFAAANSFGTSRIAYYAGLNTPYGNRLMNGQMNDNLLNKVYKFTDDTFDNNSRIFDAAIQHKKDDGNFYESQFEWRCGPLGVPGNRYMRYIAQADGSDSITTMQNFDNNDMILELGRNPNVPGESATQGNQYWLQNFYIPDGKYSITNDRVDIYENDNTDYSLVYGLKGNPGTGAFVQLKPKGIVQAAPYLNSYSSVTIKPGETEASYTINGQRFIYEHRYGVDGILPQWEIDLGAEFTYFTSAFITETGGTHFSRGGQGHKFFDNGPFNTDSTLPEADGSEARAAIVYDSSAPTASEISLQFASRGRYGYWLQNSGGISLYGRVKLGSIESKEYRRVQDPKWTKYNDRINPAWYHFGGWIFNENTRIECLKGRERTSYGWSPGIWSPVYYGTNIGNLTNDYTLRGSFQGRVRNTYDGQGNLRFDLGMPETTLLTDYAHNDGSNEMPWDPAHLTKRMVTWYSGAGKTTHSTWLQTNRHRGVDRVYVHSFADDMQESKWGKPFFAVGAKEYNTVMWNIRNILWYGWGKGKGVSRSDFPMGYKNFHTDYPTNDFFRDEYHLETQYRDHFPHYDRQWAVQVVKQGDANYIGSYQVSDADDIEWWTDKYDEPFVEGTTDQDFYRILGNKRKRYTNQLFNDREYTWMRGDNPLAYRNWTEDSYLGPFHSFAEIPLINPASPTVRDLHNCKIVREDMCGGSGDEPMSDTTTLTDTHLDGMDLGVAPGNTTLNNRKGWNPRALSMSCNAMLKSGRDEVYEPQYSSARIFALDASIAPDTWDTNMIPGKYTRRWANGDLQDAHHRLFTYLKEKFADYDPIGED